MSDFLRELKETIQEEPRAVFKEWFWNNFDCSQHSIWIGLFKPNLNFPTDSKERHILLTHMLEKVAPFCFIKLFMSPNKVGYLMICDSLNVPLEFAGSHLDLVSDIYQVTEEKLCHENPYNTVNKYLLEGVKRSS